MKRAIARLVSTFLVSALVPLASAQSSDHIVVSDQQIDRLGIQVEKAAHVTSNIVAELPARIVPAATEQTTFTAPYEGTVSHVGILAGQQVKRGEVLFEIFSRDFIAEQSGLDQARAEFETAVAALTRQRQLVDEGIAPESSLEAATSRERIARAMVTEHERSRALGIRGGRDGTYLVTASSDGIIDTVHVRVGDTLPAMASLAIVKNSDKFWAEIQVPVGLIGALQPSDSISFPGGGSGSIVSFHKKVNPSTRSGLLIANVPVSENLFSGQLVSVQLRRKIETEALLSVPASSVIEIDGKNRVFQRQPHGFAMLDVDVAGETNDAKIIRTSLRPGDEVATRGLVELKAIALQGLN